MRDGVHLGGQIVVDGRTLEELRALLVEQLGFLDRSNQLFDSGHLDEAKRLAVTLRVLFHQTPRSQSKSLIRQLALDNSLTWVDTAHHCDPRNILPTSGLAQMSIGGAGVTYVAPLADHDTTRGLPWSNLPARGSRAPFSQWWNNVVIVDSERRTFSRQSLVSALANREGGAHVDPGGDSAYKALASSNSLGWIFNDGRTSRPVDSNPVYPSIRQIAYEVLESVKQQRQLIFAGL